MSGELGSDWPAGLVRAARSSASPQQRCRLAERFAVELCVLPPAPWGRGTRSERSAPQVPAISDDPALGDIAAEAWDLALSTFIGTGWSPPGATGHWTPSSPTNRIAEHAEARGAVLPADSLLRSAMAPG